MSWTDTSRVVCYVQGHRESDVKTKEAWVDGRSSQPQALTRGYGKLGRCQPKIQEESSMANWGVNEGQAWRLQVEAYGTPRNEA